MKKLSQTWKQTRPRRESCRKHGLLEMNGERPCEVLSNACSESWRKSDGGDREDIPLPNQKRDIWWTSHMSFDWKMDSLNFESQCEVTGTAQKRNSKSVSLNGAEQCKLPDHRDLQQCTKEIISTPSDAKCAIPLGFSNNSVSPVLEKEGKKFVNEELGQADTNATVKFAIDNELSVKEGCSSECTRSIDSWGLPQCIVDKYNFAGISEIFEWQRECLLTGQALNGGNLVYSAPTSAGKTLVAEFLMLKRVLSTKRKAIYILPFVSVAREKMFYLQELFKGVGIHVDGYIGAQSPAGGFAAIDVAVCTIEKANSLVNRLMEEKKINSLGIIVIDEMHMIGDGQRGYLLELMLSKIRFLQASDSCQDDGSSCGVQVIGMSATLPNLGMLANWLNAALYITEYRPVPLIETIKVGQTIFDSNMQKISEINTNDIVKGDEEHVIPLCLETIRDCHSILIFCPTKQWCEKLAKNIADNFKPLLMKDNVEEVDVNAEVNNVHTTENTRTGFLDANSIAEVIEQLRRSPVGLDRTLADVVSYGVSFHHAGLTFDERDIIEGAFKRGAIRVLVATSTLSSGVNLPARRVILRTPMFHGKLLNPLVYKQMTGRAGRKGVDTKGESILICKSNEKQKSLKLLRSHLEPVYSCLLGKEGEGDIPGMKRALLEIIATGVASTRADVERYANCTYLKTCLAAEKDFDPNAAIQNTIQYLIENEFIRVKSEGRSDESTSVDVTHTETFSASQLGAATLASALSPDEALIVFRELQKARRCFVLENELHIVYQVMPIYIQSQLPQLDWYHYFNLFERLPPQYKRVGEIVGVEEGFLARAIRGRIPTRTEEQRQKLAIHQRFYSALALLELVNEIPLRTVSRRYNMNKGLLQSLQGSASTFAGMVTKFCEKLGWKSLEMLIDQFQSRLSFGVTRELCDLVRISLLNGARARLLFNSGYHTVSAVAMASPTELAKLLEHFAPFETRKNLQGESERELESKKRVRSFWVTGKDGMTEAEAAKEIVDEAKKLVMKDLVSMGVEIGKVEFLSDNPRNESYTNDSVEGKVNSELNGKPLDGYQLQNKPKVDLKRKLDNASSSKHGFKRCSRSLESVRNDPQLCPKIGGSSHNPMGVSNRRAENENKENAAPNDMSTNSNSLQRSNLILEVSKKPQISMSSISRDIDKVKAVERNLKECCKEIKDSKTYGQQELYKKIECEKDIGVNLDDEIVVLDNNNMKANIVECEDDLQQGSLLQNQDLISTFNHTYNRPNNTPKGNFRLGGKSGSNPSYMPYSNAEKKSEGVSKEDNDVLEGEIQSLCSDEFFNSINECSVEEDGSLILINSKDDISLDEPDENIDVTPELFSEALWGDLDLEATGKSCPRRSSAANLLTDGVCYMLNTNGIEQSEKPSSTRTERKNKSGTFNGGCIEKNGDKAAKGIAYKSNVKIGGSHEFIEDSLNEREVNSSTDIFDGSFEGCATLNPEKHADDSFHLKLSESIMEFDWQSPAILGDDLEGCKEDNVSGVLSGNRQSAREEHAVTDKETIHNIEVNGKDENKCSTEKKNDHCRQGMNQKDLCDFTKVHQKSEIDWDIILSGSDSFANALCNIGANEGSQNVITMVNERNKETRSPGPASTVIEKITGIERCKGKSHDMDNNIMLESMKEKEGDNMNEKGCIGRKGKRSTDRCEGDRGGGVKRRSSERIAEKFLQVGQTDEFTVFDVAANQDTFKMFFEVWNRKDTFSFSVARHSRTDVNVQEAPHCPTEVSGVAVCLGGNTAFFVDFLQHKALDINLSEEFDDTVKRTINMLAVEHASSKKKIVFDAKEHYKVLFQSFGLELKGRLYDPKVAAWLLDPSLKEMTLQELTLRHLPQKYRNFVNKIGSSYDTGSIGLMKHSAASPRLRSSIEAVLIHKLMDVLELRLASEGLCACFNEVEMPLMAVLAKMELNGFGFSTEQCEKLKQKLRRKASIVEARARKLAGRPFSMNSPEDVAQVLFTELGLPPSGDPNTLVTLKHGRQTRRPRHLSTAKGTLEKLRALHPLPALILEWRKVNNALTTVVYPMQRAKIYLESLDMYRIHPRCQFHTVTGRVIITEPCLQHIPKDFDFEIHDGIDNDPCGINHVPDEDKPPVTIKPEKVSRGPMKPTGTANSSEIYSSSFNNPISMRSTFVPQDGNLLIAADYSQLELRIITHLSRDKRLISILNNDGDVFRMIAAETNQCPIACVTDLQRQTAKHICYGIIYGIGRIALAEKLNVTEEEAGHFMEKFKNRFIGIKEFTRRTIDSAKSKGYVVTMGGRKRYFSTINSTTAQARSRAERQAVNTTVQGSAADLVKSAMINVENSIAREFRFRDECSFGEKKREKSFKRDQRQYTPKLVLQLHDELIYECYARDCKKFIAMLQKEMEQVLKLEVPLPVKIRTGTSWGDMTQWQMSSV